MSIVAASRYAKALFEICAAPQSGLGLETALEQLRSFEALLGAAAELRHALVTPAIPGARKRAVVDRLAGQLELHPVIRKFLFVLVDRRRTPVLAEIGRAFESLIDEHLGIVRAAVQAARELSPPQRQRLEAELARVTGRAVRCDYTADPALLGGVSVQIGSTVFDGSVRGQLDALGRRLSSEA
jgi:F-type H+-transporting ATPase subunit delta